LLLELLPPSIPTTSPDLRSLALQLFTSYRNPVDAKLSVKVASAFQLTVEDVAPQWGELEAFVADLLQDRSNYTAAVRLMLLFEVGGGKGGWAWSVVGGHHRATGHAPSRPVHCFSLVAPATGSPSSFGPALAAV
jgi:hypothetical protein